VAQNFSIEQILGYVTLSEMIETIANGVPDPLPPEFTLEGEEVIGDATRYIKATGTRAVPHLVQYGAPPVRRALRPLSSTDVKLLSVAEEQPIDALTMSRLRSPNSYERDTGYKEVLANVERFGTLFGNFEIATRLLTLANGRLGFDSSGNLLPDSSYSGAAEQVSMGINASNQGQLPYTGVNIATAPWNLNATDIPLQIRNLRKRAVQQTGVKLTHAIYGVNIPSYITQNDFCVDYMARNPIMQAEFLRTGEVPAGFCDLIWVPAYEAFWDTDDLGAATSHQAIWGDDLCVFTPDPALRGLQQWWACAKGSTVVPTSLSIATNAMTALDDTVLKFGRYGYGTINPYGPGVGLKTVMGDVFLYYLKNADAIYQMTTVF